MKNESEKPKWSNPEPRIHHALAEWAAKCAEHTLYIFEENKPNDERPRLAIESLRLWMKGELSMVDCRKAAFAAHAAARETTNPAAVAAARAAGQAVAVAHMWDHAPHAADYAAKAASLRANEDETKNAKEAEREWQWNELETGLRPLGFPAGK